jgi:hypothetical protein
MRPVLLLAFTAIAAISLAVSGPEGSNPPRYTADGQLELPADYREWVFLSSGVGMTYGPLGAGRGFPPMFDNVFVSPEAHRAFLRTGRWPDKTVFVLEVRYSASHGSINKDGHFQTGLSGLEALVKDEARFEERWSFFGFDTRGGQPSPRGRRIGKEAGCLDCHRRNGAVDGTFVQFYPTLLEVAREKGTLRPDYEPFTPSPVGLYHLLEEEGWPAGRATLVTARADDPEATLLHPAVLNQIGYDLMAAKKAPVAVALFEWVVAQNPTSANAQDSLADAFEAAGEPDRARAAARRVLELLPRDTSLTGARRKALEQASRRRLEEPPDPE